MSQEAKSLHPAVIVATVVVVVAILAVIGWKAAAPKTYTGPPINMRQMMGGHATGGPAANPALQTGKPGGPGR